LAGTQPVGVSDLVLSGFARIVTNHRIFRDPSTPSRAFDSCAAVCSAPAAVPITAGPGTGTSFAKLCRTVSARANVIPDAYLAALALEHGATFVTRDRRFARFPGLRRLDPPS